MTKKASLLNRKRPVEKSTEHREELLAMKLEALEQNAQQQGQFKHIPIEFISVDENQPRKTFKNIDDLAASIQVNGIIQPLVVREKNEQGRYAIIVGERRYQAARQAGLTSVPCIVRQEQDSQVLILQLLENDQREKVSPLEESAALQRLISEMKIKQGEVAKALGRNASWVSIRLGLRQAGDEVKSLVETGKIEDVRTLHELIQFEKEAPAPAKKLMTRIEQNKLSGSYRDAIRKARENFSAKKDIQDGMVREIESVQYEKGLISFHVKGRNRPVNFLISDKILTEIKGFLT